MLLLLLFGGTAIAQRYEGEKNRKGLPRGKGVMYWSSSELKVVECDSARLEGNFKGLYVKDGCYQVFLNGKVDFQVSGDFILEQKELGLVPLYHGYITYQQFVPEEFTYMGGSERGYFHGQGVVTDSIGVKTYAVFEKGKLKEIIRRTYPGDDWDGNKTNIAPAPEGYEGIYTFNTDINRFFRNAVKANDTEKAIQLLKRGASPYMYVDLSEIHNPLYDAIKHKNTTLIDAMASVDPRIVLYSQAIHFACAYSDSTMIDYLIAKGASLKLNGYLVRYSGFHNLCQPVDRWNNDFRFCFSPADVAVDYGRMDNLNFIMSKYKVKPTKYGFAQRLVWAIKEGSKADIDFCLNNIPNLYQKHYVRQSMRAGMRTRMVDYPLIEAVKKKDFELVKRLLDLGADPDCFSTGSGDGFNFGFDAYTSPLFEAVKLSGMGEIINLLLERGATPYKDVLQRARSEYREYFILKGLL